VVLSLLKTQRKGALNDMIDKVEFTAKNLTSNAGVLLLLNYTEEQRIFQELNEILVFDNKSTEFFRMNSGYESEEIVEVIEEAGYHYVVKAKEYSNKARKFAVVRELKPEEDRKQLNAGVQHIPAIQNG
jgi:hypothetical protein